LRAAAPILNERSSIRAVICGAAIYDTSGHDNYDKELLTLCEELGISGKVFWLPFQKDPSVVYSALDVMVHASCSPEPFGRVVSEARLCRTAVIATGAGGITEQIVDGETGILVPLCDVETLRQAIQQL